MADQTKVATGHNNTAGYVTFTMAESPWIARINFGIIRLAMSEIALEDGDRWAEFRWLPKVPDSINQSVRSKFGLTGYTLSANVTVHLPTNAARSTFADFNGLAVLDNSAEYERKGWSGLVIAVLFLDAI